MKLLVQCMAVGTAGFFGAVARFLVALLCGRYFTGFPIGTLVINLTGSFFLGWFATIVAEKVVVHENLRLAVAVGFVGAYTTFSTWTFESNALLEQGAVLKSLVNLIGSLVFGLIAVKLGVGLARRF